MSRKTIKSELQTVTDSVASSIDFEDSQKSNIFRNKRKLIYTLLIIAVIATYSVLAFLIYRLNSDYNTSKNLYNDLLSEKSKVDSSIQNTNSKYSALQKLYDEKWAAFKEYFKNYEEILSVDQKIFENYDKCVGAITSEKLTECQNAVKENNEVLNLKRQELKDKNLNIIKSFE